MYEELIKSLRLCREILHEDDSCIEFVDGGCEAFPICAYQLMEKAADAIEKLQQTVEQMKSIVMVHPCDKPCGNKTASGYCATSVCINPQYSNIGTAQYGQGVQKRIITNADRIRSMTDEELAEWFDGELPSKPKEWWLDWLRQEAID